jgi:glycine/D-amino acid oxidase-like deaminating enzyme
VDRAAGQGARPGGRHRGIDCGFERTGELAVATAPWQLDGLARDAAAARGYGEDVVEFDAAGVRAELDSPTYLGGTWYRGGCAILDPAALAWGLRRACLDAGVRIYEHTPVRSVTDAGHAGLRLSTPHGAVHAPRVALAAGCYQPLLRRLRRYLVPVYDYARLAAHFFETFPALAGQVRFTHAWGGVIDTCSRFCAFFGTAYGGRLGYAAGYTGPGVGASRFGASVVLDLLGGEPTERTSLRMVRTKPVPFPPEPVRSAVIQLTRASLARADRHEGRRDLWLRTLDRLGLGFDS